MNFVFSVYFILAMLFSIYCVVFATLNTSDDIKQATGLVKFIHYFGLIFMGAMGVLSLATLFYVGAKFIERSIF